MPFLAPLALLIAQAGPALPAAESAPAVAYADMADLALASPVAAVAEIGRATRIRPAQAPDVAPGRTRFYVEATIVALLKGQGGLPPAVTYLVDVPNDARGRPVNPRSLRGLRVILIARPVTGRAGEIQLVAPDAQIDWTPADDTQLRAILTEAASGSAPPAVTGIGSAFSVAGTLPGESETQIFVTTADRRPMTISVLRRPGERPRWSVSQSEIVDESAAAPRPGTLLWYRLACGLPTSLPARVLADGDRDSAGRAQADYRFVRESLGPCGRQRELSSTPTPAQSG